MNKVAELEKTWGLGSKAEPYYAAAETPGALQIFWGKESPFLRLFRLLDRRALIELACGRGRHTAHIRKTFPDATVILLDVVLDNIEHCKKRFAGDAMVSAYRNSGCDFQPVALGKASGIFCYDSMVHFEQDVVLSYLGDAARVLVLGGRALFHHSNYTPAPGNAYQLNPHWRNFMSKELFAEGAARSGFHILEQIVMQWGDVPALDCLTLLERNA